MDAQTLKSETEKLMSQLPDDPTWEDLMYAIYVRQAVEEGLADSKAGRTIDVKDIRRQFGLDK